MGRAGVSPLGGVGLGRGVRLLSEPAAPCEIPVSTAPFEKQLGTSRRLPASRRLMQPMAHPERQILDEDLQIIRATLAQSLSGCV